MKWKRIVEVRGKGGAAEGLEYHYPCGHSQFVSAEEILANMKDPSVWSLGGGLVATAACPEGCEEETEADVKEALNK